MAQAQKKSPMAKDENLWDGNLFGESDPPPTAAKDAYTAKDIEVVEGLEPVRKRPGMYIGGVDERALHHWNGPQGIKYFNTLEAWRVDKFQGNNLNQTQNQSSNQQSSSSIPTANNPVFASNIVDNDDLPF